MDTIRQDIISAGDLSGNLTTDPITLNNILHISVFAEWAGTPTGTLYLECSTDNNNWFELSNVALAGAADNQLWIDKNAPYRWARLRYAFTAGVGTLNVHAIKKGDK
jgi:hypothetical protein